jgi:hypothetical protein
MEKMGKKVMMEQLGVQQQLFIVHKMEEMVKMEVKEEKEEEVEI